VFRTYVLRDGLEHDVGLGDAACETSGERDVFEYRCRFDVGQALSTEKVDRALDSLPSAFYVRLAVIDQHHVHPDERELRAEPVTHPAPADHRDATDGIRSGPADRAYTLGALSVCDGTDRPSTPPADGVPWPTSIRPSPSRASARS